MFARRLWVRAVLISCLALVAAALTPLSHLIPIDLSGRIDEDALTGLLSILTNSMLTVTTFSLSIMVSAHLAADSNATPRAHRLLQQDGRTQTVIATFIGAFIYALVMTTMLNVGLFESADYPLIYVFTVGILGLVIVAVLRWVAHLSGLGSVEATIRRVEERAHSCLKARIDRPFLGGRSLIDTPVPGDAPAFQSDSFGFVQNIDTEKLNDLAQDWAARVFVTVRPGDWIGKGGALGYVDVEALDETSENALRGAIAIGDRREYDQDATFSLVVLAEIAERALSPGINDPRTALDVIGRITRMVANLPVERELDEPYAPGVYCQPMERRDLLLATLDPIARDGRTFVEVQLALQRAYATLSEHRDPGVADAAMALSSRALSYARDGIMLVEDLHRVARFAPADHMAATSAAEPKTSVIDALGEERNSSFFTDS
ncbi:DUF2254 domain-containing protein [Maribius pontilimi]|uniref:DUF2254 domain-containing protein n=1 Tax=Palleronia pontilimi TaxID=1964209 RepID=A0A934IFE0_9RHOB|nr:DUF2254 domain-containing protein [Palleronia pontilimi]MBJ3762445.1 DUF2254 domain-containing protein [Palleronia pontilimi]